MKCQCLACNLSPLMWLGRIFGFTALSWKCPGVYKPSYFWLSISSIVAASLGVVAVSNLQDIYTRDFFKYNNKVRVVFSIIDTLHLVIAFLFVFIGIFQVKQRGRSFQAVTKLLNNRFYYGLDEIISVQDLNQIWRSSLMHCACTFLTVCGLDCYILYAAFKNYHPEIDTKIFIAVIMKNFMSTGSDAIFMAFCFQFVSSCRILESMMNKLLFSLRDLLCPTQQEQLEEPSKCKPTKKSRKNWVVPLAIVETTLTLATLDKKPEIPLFKRISQLRVFYGSILSCLQQMNKSLNPQLLLQMAMLIVCLVLNAYLVVQFLVIAQENDMFYLSLIRLIFHSGAAIFLVNVSEDLYRSSLTTFRVLMSFDISKFSIEESVQIELLLHQLYYTPPLFSASGVFHVSSRILASVFGTIITYVLVALQFKAAWTKHELVFNETLVDN